MIAGVLVRKAFAFKNRRVCTLLTCLAVTFSAKAEVWVWVDEQGASHFAAQQLDARYTALDTALNTAANAEAPPASTAPARPRLQAYFEGSPRYRKVRPLLQAAAARFGVDYALLQAVVAAESGFDPDAVSAKGAIGLMQVMPDTARRFGVDSDRWLPVERKLTHPTINVYLGTRYLRVLLDQFPGRVDLALAAYNAGEGAVQHAGNAVPSFKETQNYVATVGALYAALRTPATDAASAPAMAKASYGDAYVLRATRDPYVLTLPVSTTGAR